MMKLFIAITLQDPMKEEISNTIEQLKTLVKRGRFTRKENLHLTLVFLGETNRIDEVKQGMTEAVLYASGGAFQMVLEGLGYFRRREGDIYWLGIKEEPALFRIQRELVKALNQRGFSIEERKFKPHLTLGRRVIVESEYQKIESDIPNKTLSMEVSNVSLMKSENINGVLTYTELFHVVL